MQVSRAAAQLDAVLQEWRERPLGDITYLYVDAHYEKVREAGQVRDAAILVASGITPEGERQVLGVSEALSEHESHSPRGCFAVEILSERAKGSRNAWVSVSD